MSARPPSELSDVAKLVRARRLLAATLDDHRAIVGEVSREWIRSETERRVSPDRLAAALREHAAAGLGPDEIAGGTPVNTNRLPKLEPAISAHVLTGTLLYGARLYGSGTPDPAEGVRCAEIDNDLIVAAMIVDTPGQVDRLSAFLPERWRRVDDGYLGELLGPEVVERLCTLRRHRAAFRQALATGRAPETSIPGPCASAIAAIEASMLRLTARAAGDRVFATLDPPKRDELRAKGIDPGEPADPFPERPYLERDHAVARAAVELPGVERETLLLPIRELLLNAVADVLERGVRPERLIGRYGSAVRNFHVGLPLVERFSPIVRRTAGGGKGVEVEGPYALGTLHVTGLEVVRYLHKVRRKGCGTGAGHSFLVAARAESMLGTMLSVPVVAASDCHDVVEDGGFEVTGYDHTLELFASRFGAPLAALVAEVTDSITREDGPAKARAFAERPTIPTLEELYNRGQLEELRATATDPSTPYSLAGAVMKLADTVTTMEEGLRDPDLMTGPWRYSGARVRWDLESKGPIVRPLLQRFATEIGIARADPFWSRRAGAFPACAIERFVEIVRTGLEIADLYLVQNLTLLADEYALNEPQRRELLAVFADRSRDRADVEAWLDRRLDDSRLDAEVRRRGFPASFRLAPDGKPQRDLSRLLDYREAALWRAAVRADLALAAPSAEQLDDVVRLHDLRLGRLPRLDST